MKVTLNIVITTSRDRPKSAPYPRLKNSKKTSKCQVFSFTVLENRKLFEKKVFEKITYSKKWTEWRAKVSQCQKTEMGDLLGFFNIQSVAKHEKIEENKTFYFREKISMPKKTERGDPLGFSNIHSVAKHQKNAGGPFGENVFFSKKRSRSAEKKKGGTLGSRSVWYVTRKNKKNLFGSVR